MSTNPFTFQGELYPHQERALAWMQEIEADTSQGMEGGILSLTQGLGKTLTAITHVVRRWETSPEEQRRPSLILVKKAVMPEWKRCIERFYPGLITETLFYHADFMGANNMKAVTQRMINSKILVITTYDTLRYRGYKKDIDCCLVYGAENSRFRGKVMSVSCRTLHQTQKTVTGRRVVYYTPWEYVFSDESQVFANPKTATYRSVMGVYGRKKWCLTGTPIRNTDLDLFAQLRWCGLRDSFADTPKEWRTFVKHGYYRSHRLDRYILSMDYDSAEITLPRKERHVIPIDFATREEMEMYRAIREKVKEVLRSASINSSITYAHVLALFTRLRQTCVACHAITPQSKRDNRGATNLFKPDTEMARWCLDKDSAAGTSSSKLLKMVEIINDVPAGEKVVVFSNFVALMDLAEASVILNTDDIETFMIEGSISGPERDQQLRDFKAHDGKAVLFVNYKVGAEGLNITEANHVICLEPWWTYATHAQAESRCWRIGQTRTVHVYDILVRDSIEAKILEICTKKRIIAESFLGQNDALVSDTTRLSLDMIGKLLQ